MSLSALFGGPLPPLREDLGLHEAPPAPDGSPCWRLADPAANRYYQLAWPAFEILARWHLGDAEAIADAVNSETTLELEQEDVYGVLDFLSAHYLLEARSQRDTARLMTAVKARQTHPLAWLVKNYLFFRIPLVRPGAFLSRWSGVAAICWRREFWIAVAALALLALFLVGRQWDAFMHGFTAYQGWQGMLALGVAMSFAKVGHELGHAFAAQRHGCRVPAMGVAFLVMWPVLYTDTNEAWKLVSRKARLQIGAAGMAAELVLAVLATLAWVMLPDGELRAGVFFLATGSWVLTLLVNASPFMRFDGYFLLSDWLGMPNLHERAFAMGRWWLRERLFGLNAPPPEDASPQLRHGLAGFALATWCYRLVVFFGIALVVYHAFFKLLGMVLFAIELGWFIVLPAVRELRAWWALRAHMRWNRRSAMAAGGLAAALALLVLPWQGGVSAPGVLAPAREQVLNTHVPARVVELPAAGLREVREGQVLARLESPELTVRLEQAREAEANWRQRLEQQSFSAELLEQGAVLRRHWEEAAAQLKGLEEEQARLTVRAPFDGVILARNFEIGPGSWLPANEMLLAVADRRASQVHVLVGEDDLGRLHPGAAARFVPEAVEFGRRRCVVSRIDPFNAAQIDEPALASVHGGRIAARPDAHGALLPAATVYRVTLDHCDPATAPLLRLRGTAHLEADRQSLAAPLLRQLGRVLMREAGF